MGWALALVFGSQALAQVPAWESLKCDSTRKVGTLDVYDLVLPVYRTDTLRELAATSRRVWAFVTNADGQNTLLGSYERKDSLRPASGADALQKRAYLSALVEDPTVLYSRWAWLLDTTRQVFLARRNALVDSLRRRMPNYEIRVISDLRSAELQTRLLGRGRSMAPVSFHQLGLAADLGIFRRGRLVRNTGPYSLIGELTPHWNLYWGGDFVGFVDPPHFQYHYNAAAFLRQFPALRFEFEPFYEYYLKRVRQKIEAGKETDVEDTKALLVVLNEFRTQMPCPCLARTTAAPGPNLYLPAGTITDQDLVLAGNLKTQTLSVWLGNNLLISYRLGIWH